jgi:hypothetical protein
VDLIADAPVFVADFGSAYICTRTAAQIVAVAGAQDGAALDGYVLGRAYQITYPTADLQEGDELTRVSDSSRWTVRDPQSITDGVFYTAALEQRT